MTQQNCCSKKNMFDFWSHFEQFTSVFYIILLAMRQQWNKFSRHWEFFFEILKCRSNHEWKGFKMIYLSTQSDDYLW